MVLAFAADVSTGIKKAEHGPVCLPQDTACHFSQRTCFPQCSAINREITGQSAEDKELRLIQSPTLEVQEGLGRGGRKNGRPGWRGCDTAAFRA